jgi:hypothetical protein
MAGTNNVEIHQIRAFLTRSQYPSFFFRGGRNIESSLVLYTTKSQEVKSKMRNPAVIRKLTTYSIVSFIVTLIALVALVFLMGCQQESVEIIEPAQEEVITPGSGLAGLMVNTSASDGSPDNILDGSSCLSVVFPVSAVVNGKE